MYDKIYNKKHARGLGAFCLSLSLEPGMGYESRNKIIILNKADYIYKNSRSGVKN